MTRGAKLRATDRNHGAQQRERIKPMALNRSAMRSTSGIMAVGAAALLVGLTALAARAAGPENWPQFRGPEGNGHAPGAQPPVEWGEEENVAWKVAIDGRAWSSPIVQDGRVWVTTASEDGHERGVVAVDAKTGEKLIEKKLFDVPQPQDIHRFNSYASPTPVAEPGRVYVTFGAKGTAALDADTGEVLWERTDLRCNHYRGAGSSPILFDGLLIMNFDGSDYQYVIALDKKTGETIWRTDRSIEFDDLNPDGSVIREGDFRKAFSTPHVIEADGDPVLISLGAKAGYAYDPYTGEELWRYEERDNHSASTRPVFAGGLVFCPTGLPRGLLWAINPSGIDPDSTELINDTDHVAWRYTRSSSVPAKPSLLHVDGHLYFTSDSGAVTCLDADTGQERWKGRIDGEYSASPIYADGRLYFFNQSGTATVVAADPNEFEVLATNELDEGFMGSPAVVSDSLILRTKTHLYRIEE